MSFVEKVLEGFRILAKYPNCEVAAQHDQIYFGPDDGNKVSDEDRAKLEDLGWFIDSETDSWSRLV